MPQSAVQISRQKSAKARICLPVCKHPTKSICHQSYSKQVYKPLRNLAELIFARCYTASSTADAAVADDCQLTETLPRKRMQHLFPRPAQLDKASKYCIAKFQLLYLYLVSCCLDRIHVLSVAPAVQHSFLATCFPRLGMICTPHIQQSQTSCSKPSCHVIAQHGCCSHQTASTCSNCTSKFPSQACLTLSHYRAHCCCRASWQLQLSCTADKFRRDCLMTGRCCRHTVL